MSQGTKILLAAALIVAIATGAGVWILGDRLTGQAGGSGTALIGGPFTLTDHSGKRVTEKDYDGKFRLIYFGYTFCPDVCPTELQNMAVALDLLGDDADGIVPLFITVDPERDTVEVLSEYAPYFHDRMVGLTGSPDDVAAAAKAYRVYFSRVEPEDEDGVYLVDHSSLVYLMGRDGTYVQHFPHLTAPEKMVEAIRKVL